ncbi:hypothetical protein ACT79_22775 [Burkholderia pseudomallei]|nr:hypothetical protein ACT79_22775 [Burkholderia pseudomallei]
MPIGGRTAVLVRAMRAADAEPATFWTPAAPVTPEKDQLCGSCPLLLTMCDDALAKQDAAH